LKVTTGSGALNININAGFTWTSASRLTLDSAHSVIVNQPVTVAGTGALTIATNGGGSDGDLRFLRHGNFEFWDLASSLVINGNGYMLVMGLHQLANAVKANPTGFYALSKDHNASRDGTYRKSPVVTYLSGTFEGLGHAISGLVIVNKEEIANVGLFARIAFGGVVRDVHLPNVKIKGQASATIGALAGDNWGTVRNSDVSGVVENFENSGGACVGSLVGFNENASLVYRANAIATLDALSFNRQSAGGWWVATTASSAPQGPKAARARMDLRTLAGSWARTAPAARLSHRWRAAE